jgi:hypothetical protein
MVAWIGRSRPEPGQIFSRKDSDGKVLDPEQNAAVPELNRTNRSHHNRDDVKGDKGEQKKVEYVAGAVTRLRCFEDFPCASLWCHGSMVGIAGRVLQAAAER